MTSNATGGIERNPASAAAWTSAVAGLIALVVAMGIGRFAFTPILPMMQDDFGLSVSAAGWLASANYLGYFAGSLSAIALRVRATVAIRAGLLVIGLSTLAMGLQHHFVLWIILRFAAGVVSAWVLIFVSSWALERLARLERHELSGLMYAGVGAGIALAGAVCLVAARLHVDSAGAWLACGVLSIVLTVLIWPLLNADGSDTPASTIAPPPAADAGIRVGGHWRVVASYGAFGFGYIIPATFLPLIAKTIIPDPALFGWAWPLFGAAATVSTVVAARLYRNLSYRSVWIGSQLIMALGVAVPLVVPGLGGIILAALLVGGTFMVVTMTGLQEARRVGGAQARGLIAAMTSVFAFGQIVGPIVTGFLSRSNDGIATASIVAAAVLVLGVIPLAGSNSGTSSSGT